MWNRRELLRTSLATVALSRWGSAFADEGRQPRLIVVILRGGLDGLGAVPAYGDPHYARARGAMALPKPGRDEGILNLDGLFGLHPSLAPVLPLWEAGQLSIVHAVSSPYRARSHFDAQDVLENGTARPFGSDSGWLNRALLGQTSPGQPALAVGRNLPKMLRGPAAATSTDPTRKRRGDEDFLTKLSDLYAADPQLDTALQAGIASNQMLAQRMTREDARGSGRRSGDPTQVAHTVGGLLAQPGGAHVAVLEMSGWDTHANQAGTLRRQLGQLGQSIAAFQNALGPAWRDTVMVTVTEFGRTVHPNGTGGTDHGTGGVCLLAGGAVQGGKVHTQWPGLSDRDLLDGRDLMPTTDLRSVLKGILSDHLAISSAHLEEVVFPDSRSATPMSGLVVG